MVRLLVTRTTVMRYALRTLADSNGFGQSVVAFRRYPYANRIAPNVTASEMMNSHITSFLWGMANAGASRVSTTEAMVRCPSLTFSLFPLPSFCHPEVVRQRRTPEDLTSNGSYGCCVWVVKFASSTTPANIARAIP